MTNSRRRGLPDSRLSEDVGRRRRVSLVALQLDPQLDRERARGDLAREERPRNARRDVDLLALQGRAAEGAAGACDVRERVTVVHRTARGWEETDRRGGEHVALEEPALSFAVDDLYAGIALDPPA